MRAGHRVYFGQGGSDRSAARSPTGGLRVPPEVDGLPSASRATLVEMLRDAGFEDATRRPLGRRRGAAPGGNPAVSETPLAATASRTWGRRSTCSRTTDPGGLLLRAVRPRGFGVRRRRDDRGRAGVRADPAAFADDRRVARRRSAIHPDGPPPIAVAAIPFDDDAPATATIPARAAIRREPGETWQIDVTAEGLAPPDATRERWTGRDLPHAAFDEMQLRADPDPDDYAVAVEIATRRIRARELRKVVLARTLIVDAERSSTRSSCSGAFAPSTRTVTRSPHRRSVGRRARCSSGRPRRCSCASGGVRSPRRRSRGPRSA